MAVVYGLGLWGEVGAPLSFKAIVGGMGLQPVGVESSIEKKGPFPVHMSVTHVWAAFDCDEETDYARVQAWSITIYLIFCFSAP